MSRTSTICNIAIWLGLSLTAVAQVPTVDKSSYILGPGDQVSLFIQDLADEFGNKTFRIDSNGELSLPVIGRIQAAGISVAKLETECKSRLDILKDPQVVVSVVNFGGQPISVLGAVNSPGIRQLEGSKTLSEVLSASGGLRADAGYQVKITRAVQWGPIPLPQTKLDSTGESYVAAVDLSDIINATNPAENIEVRPGDVISVPKAELVYVIGSVTKAGGIALNEHRSISTLQAVSLAEGLSKTAASDRARILRTVPGSPTRVEIAVNLKKLIDGKIPDISLEPNDILYVPSSGAKVASQRTIDVMVGAASAAIWRF